MSQNFAGRRRRKKGEGGTSQRSPGGASDGGGSDKIIVDQDLGGDDPTPSPDSLAAGPDESTSLVGSPMSSSDTVSLGSEGDVDEETAHVRPLPPPARLARPAEPVAVSPALAYADESDVSAAADDGHAYGAHYREQGAAGTSSSRSDSLIDMLSNPVAQSMNPLGLEDVMAAPGEVPALHSNAGLYSMWTLIALLIAGGVAFGIWAVFFYQPL